MSQNGYEMKQTLKKRTKKNNLRVLILTYHATQKKLSKGGFT